MEILHAQTESSDASKPSGPRYGAEAVGLRPGLAASRGTSNLLQASTLRPCQATDRGPRKRGFLRNEEDSTLRSSSHHPHRSTAVPEIHPALWSALARKPLEQLVRSFRHFTE